MKIKVALLAGGDSSERAVSLESARQVAAALERSKYEVYTIDVRGREWIYRDSLGRPCEVDLRDFSVTAAGRKTVFDCALIMIHGNPGENGRMQGYLDLMGVPYPSSGLVSSAVTFDKAVCKALVSGAGIRVARHEMLRGGQNYDPVGIVSTLGLPLFVKPVASGSSCGVTKVKNLAQLPSAVKTAFSEGDAVLIEEFIAGREFACGVYRCGGRTTALPITEIIAKNEFFDYEAKYTPGKSDEITPADISPRLERRLKSAALRAYDICDCRGIARVDFLVTASDDVYMIEVNTIPGMSAGSIVPKQILSAGSTLGAVLDEIISDLPCTRR